MFLDYDVGELIYNLRTQRNVSQEVLSEGICNAGTISKIENGGQVPRRELLQEILERLGGSGFFHSYYLERACYGEMYLKRQIIEAFEYGQIDYLDRLLHEYEDILDEANPRAVQFIRFAKLLYWNYLCGDRIRCTDECIELINMTCNIFPVKNIQENILFDGTESMIINVLAVSYYYTHRPEAAEDLLKQLLSRLSESRHFLPQYWKARAVILNNIALCKSDYGENKNALVIMDEAVKCGAKEGGNLLFLKLLRNRTGILGKLPDCIRKYKRDMVAIRHSLNLIMSREEIGSFWSEGKMLLFF